MAGFEILTTRDLLAKVSIGKGAMLQKIYRAHKRDGIMLIPGHGYFFIRKPGKEFRILKIKVGESTEESAGTLNQQVISILEQQAKHVCNSCRDNVINPMMKAATNKPKGEK
jgi:hypothetical protein